MSVRVKIARKLLASQKAAAQKEAELHANREADLLERATGLRKSAREAREACGEAIGEADKFDSALACLEG